MSIPPPGAMHACIFVFLNLFISQGLADVTRTLALVKPHALQHAEDIREEALDQGFNLLAFSRVGMDKESAQQFYQEHAERPFYEELVEAISSGPLGIMVLEKEKAVSSWRKAIGPTDPDIARQIHKNSIRARYGESILNNAVHGSSSVASAKIEIAYFFPDLAEFDGDEEDMGEEDEYGEHYDLDNPINYSLEHLLEQEDAEDDDTHDEL